MFKPIVRPNNLEIRSTFKQFIRKQKTKLQIFKHLKDEFQITFTSMEQAMKEYLSKREEYRKNKDFDQADLMRDQLKEIGLLIKDGENTGWYWENR